MPDIACDYRQDSAAEYGDLMLTDDGDFAMTSDVPGGTTNPVLQNVLQRLRSFRGEWFLNAGDGIPWFQSILGPKGVTPSDVAAIFSDAILTTPGIVQLTQIDVTLDTRQRQCSLTFKAESIAGAIAYDGTLEYAA